MDQDQLEDLELSFKECELLINGYIRDTETFYQSTNTQLSMNVDYNIGRIILKYYTNVVQLNCLSENE